MPFSSGQQTANNPAPSSIDSTSAADDLADMLVALKIMNRHLSDMNGQIYDEDDTE